MKLLWHLALLAAAGSRFSLAAPAQSTPQYIPPSEAGPHGSAPGMQVKRIDFDMHGHADYAVIFRPGDDPYAGLTAFAEKYHVKSGHFIGLGGFRDVKLAWFDLPKKMFRVNPVDQQVEVASLVGDIALFNGKPVVHMHCVVALEDGTTRGGHILEADVNPLLEVFVTTDVTALRKKHDPATGLTLMDPRAR